MMMLVLKYFMQFQIIKKNLKNIIKLTLLQMYENKGVMQKKKNHFFLKKSFCLYKYFSIYYVLKSNQIKK